MHWDCFVTAWICFLKALLQMFHAVILAKALTYGVCFSFGNVCCLYPIGSFSRLTITELSWASDKRIANFQCFISPDFLLFLISSSPRWPWSIRTCGLSSTPTAPRWWSPSLAGELLVVIVVWGQNSGRPIFDVFCWYELHFPLSSPSSSLSSPLWQLWAIIIIPNGVVSVSERTKPAIKIASFLPGFILMPAKR